MTVSMRAPDDELRSAVAEGIPRKYVDARCASISADGEAAVILVLLDSGTAPTAMISFCERTTGSWRELVLTDADGATGVNWAAGRWVSYAVGKVPTPAADVKVHFGPHTVTACIADRYFFAAWWGSADESAPPDGPVVEI